MRIPPAQVTELVRIMKESYSEEEMLELNVTCDLPTTVKVDFRNDADGAYNRRVVQYVEKLQEKNTTAEFVRILHEDDRDNDDVAALHTAIGRLYTKKKNKWVWNRKAFNRPILLDRLAFIDREIVKTEVYFMVDRLNPRIIRIDGEDCAGLSYIGYYLEEISGTMDCFQVVRIDFKRHISLPNSGSDKLAPHLAKMISDSVSLYNDTKNWNEFKITTFITDLKLKFANDPRTLLIFIDQFDFAGIRTSTPAGRRTSTGSSKRWPSWPV